MKNTRTLISSSLVSLIIIILGLFMLCMSRAPRISFDEPLVEGGGVANDSVGVDDQDFLTMLNDSGDDALDQSGDQSASNEDDILSLLNEDDQSTTAYDESTTGDSADQGMEDILRLLDLEDENSADSQAGSGTESTEDNWLQELTSSESGETSTQLTEDNSTNAGSIDELNKQVEQLENVLAEKSSEVENLQAEINQYDQRINEFERQASGSGSYQSSVKPVSYQQTSTPASEPGYDSYDDNAGETFYSSDFEQSYNNALSLYQNHQFQQAADAFFQLLQQDPNNALADNCQYWIGECRFAQGKYYQAVAEFNKVFAYDAPDKQDDAQLMLGLAYLKLGDLNCARSELDWLVSCYASSEYVNTANRYLGQL